MNFKTLDGVVHWAHVEMRTARQFNGERLRFRVLVTNCGVEATGSETPAAVNCRECKPA